MTKYDGIKEEEILSVSKGLKSAKRIYEGNNGEKVTLYEKGTKISEMKAEHQKLVDKDEIQKGER